MDDHRYDCIIIGGGISGISFAHYMHKLGKETLVIEKEPKAGGQIQSILSDDEPDYWRDLGAHTCYNSYTHLLSIVKDIDATNEVRPLLGKGRYVIYAEGKIKKMFSEMSVLSLLLNGVKIFFTSKKNKTVKEYFGNIVGRKNYDRLFSRLFRAVISQSADEYPAELFLKHRNDRFKEFPRKFTFSKGLVTILDEIIRKDGLNIEYSREVIDIQEDEENLGYKVLAMDGKSYSATNVAFATDPHTTARFVKDLDIELAELLRSIPLFRTDSLNVIVPKDRIRLEPVAGIIPVLDDFHSAVSRDLVEDRKLRSFTFHFEKGEKNINEKYDIICSVLGISRDDILETKEVSHVLPSLRLEHLNMSEQVRATKRREGIHILGNYFYGLSLEDCVQRSFDVSNEYN